MSILFNLTLFDYLLFVLLVACIVYLHYQQIRLRKLLPYKSSSKKTKILSVVAGENIDTTSIEKALYATDITYNLLSYDSVSQDSFLAELAKDVTIAEISSHGLNGAFRLGNTTLPISWLVQVLQHYPKVECVLLLYCKSYLDISAITATGKHTVGLVDEVEDSTCIIFSRQFYYYLNKSYDYKEAFELARLSLHPNYYAKFIFAESEKTRHKLFNAWSKIW